MKKIYLFTVLFGCLLTIGFVYAAPAQHKAVNDAAAAGFKRLADRGEVLTSHLPAHIQDVLSAGGRQLIEIHNKYADIQRKFQHARLPFDLANIAGPRFFNNLQTGPVSDPNSPLELASRLFGFTQSETSASWCGINAVIGFNDSGSLLEQLLVSPSQSFSFDGYGRSTDEAKTFTDAGFLNSDPVPPGATFYDLFGDPVLRCTSTSTFYYASLAAFTSSTEVHSDISVSKSIDAGASFAGPVPAASKDAFTHFLDKPWMAVDPTNANNIYVTYTDFDFSGAPPCTVQGGRTGIEMVRSTDAGATWSAPVVIKEVCDPSTLQGSNVVVDGTGIVYVGYEDLGDDFPFSARSFNVTKSTDGGSTFGSIVMVSDIVCLGDCFLLQGGFRDFVDTPGTALAVDRSGGAFNGRVYACWQDGRNFSQPDPLTGGQYNFGDILCSSSTDQGATWSSPVRVNDDTTGPQDIDQFQASVAVDKRGFVGVLFYDRRNDARNFLVGASFAVSKDGGTTFQSNDKLFNGGFPAIINADGLINPVYMGDYNAITEDFLSFTKGFLAPYGQNFLGDPNVDSQRKTK